jgi:RNA polymerase sigma-70 factor (ECF subfamily)
MMQTLSDEQVLDDYSRTGDGKHLSELVSRHVGRVRAMIYPMVLNNADADDLTQEVFLRVMNGISRFKREASFSTWLYRITVNTTHTFLKRAYRNRKRLEFRDEVPEHADGREGPSGIVQGNETDRMVSLALASLPDHLRMAITLTVINGVSAKEAARAEGCLTATMYWRIHEARRILKSKLNMVRT